ncbi:arabinofuranosidase catalytic domain-containing protein [Paraburkholderia adhaesiva]|uniref:arabinofuranosidase catalytic domain-containing protein n=1 Tax=Paraburkholderia adhaesiva TaxID=2883244 RepID=UPI001F295990|nr:arabinofuranosidase catalytic domain-containing protein [Paraburkholderia adhaesiva]
MNLSRLLLMVTTRPWRGLLDELATPAAGAWSLRRLTGAYAGPCINVRRDSDNTTQDISFTLSGDLNVAGLLAFVGAGNGFVKIWYDQMPGAAHLSQANMASQPQIVANGKAFAWPSWSARQAIETNGGTLGANGSFLCTSIPAAALVFPQPLTRSSVLAFPWELASGNGNPIVLNSGDTTHIELYQGSNSTLITFAYNTTSGGTGFTCASGIAVGTTGQVLELLNEGASTVYFNGMPASGGVGTGESEMMCVGADNNGVSRCSQGLYGEVIEFAQLLPATDQQALLMDQCAYWGTASPYRALVLSDSPYAYWPLDESSGTTAKDISGNARNGSKRPTTTVLDSMLVSNS